MDKQNVGVYRTTHDTLDRCREKHKLLHGRAKELPKTETIDEAARHFEAWLDAELKKKAAV